MRPPYKLFITLRFSTLEVKLWLQSSCSVLSWILFVLVWLVFFFCFPIKTPALYSSVLCDPWYLQRFGSQGNSVQFIFYSVRPLQCVCGSDNWLVTDGIFLDEQHLSSVPAVSKHNVADFGTGLVVLFPSWWKFHMKKDHLWSAATSYLYTEFAKRNTSTYL